MLRVYFVQHWFRFNLADAACEDALLDSAALCRLVGIGLGRERVPDATTLLKFRRLLEKHRLGEALFAQVGQVHPGIVPRIARRGVESSMRLGHHRWMVERTFAWLPASVA